MSVTIKDIARISNVSLLTVSHALNDHPRISTETKKHIQDLAKRMGYVPSQVARNLVAQWSATIGVAFADFFNPFYMRLTSSIEVCPFHQCDLFVWSFYRDPKRKINLFDSFHEKRQAGMIVAGSSLDEEYLSRIDHAIPAVLVDSCSYPISISVE